MNGYVKKFEQINHQADLAFVVYGENEKELLLNFVDLLKYLFSIKKVSDIVKMKTFNLRKLEDLIFDLGNEIIYEYEANKNFPSKLNFRNFELHVTFSKVVSHHEPISEIKALTYHHLKVEKYGDHFKTMVVFDV